MLLGLAILSVVAAIVIVIVMVIAHGKEKRDHIHRSCETCNFYAEWHTKDTLNPDKTVTRGQLRYRVCGYNKPHFELHDTTPCEKWSPDNGRAKPYALTFALMNEEPPSLK